MLQGAQKYWVILCLISLLVMFTGCADNSGKSPTTPEQKNTEQPPNFWASEGNSEGFGAYVGSGFFKVSVPQGDYLLTYSTWNSGAYHLAFRASRKAILDVGLMPGAQVFDVSIQQGAVIPASGETWISEPVTLYSWPGGASPVWGDVFENAGGARVLIKSGQVDTASGVVLLPKPGTTTKTAAP